MPVKYRVLEATGKAGGGRRRGGNGKEARVRGVMRECVARVSADRASKARRVKYGTVEVDLPHFYW
jgi:hypothetical protein